MLASGSAFRAPHSVVLASVLAIPPGGALAQLDALGPELQVNTDTIDFQQQAAVAADAAGGFVVVWSSSFEPSLLGDCCQTIEARRFDGAGTPRGDQFQVSTGATSYQLSPAIAADGVGGFVVSWTSNGSSGTDTDFLSVQARRFDAAGNPLADRFQVNTFTPAGQYAPAVAMDADSELVVVWNSVGSAEGDSGPSIQARRFDANGDPLGGDLQVNTYTAGAQHLPAVARAPGGAFVVAWVSDGSGGDDTDGWSIQARRYDAAGAPLGGQFQVNTLTTGTQFRPAVAMDADDGFVIVWDSAVSSGDDKDAESIQARRFGSDGSPAGPEIQVNAYTTGAQLDPTIALAGGGFVVSWTSEGSAGGDADSFSIQARLLDSGALPVGAQIQVNSYTPSAQRAPAVATAPSGRSFVAWESLGSSGPDLDASGILAQVLRLALFADGFESGDTEPWSATSP